MTTHLVVAGAILAQSAEPSYTNQWGAVMVRPTFRVHLCLNRPTWRVYTSLPLNGSPRLPLTLLDRTNRPQWTPPSTAANVA